VSGDLTYDDEGLRLTLEGTLLDAPRTLQAMTRGDELEYPLVLGETLSGREVTLSNSLVVGTEMQLIRMHVSLQRLAPRVAYLGIHLPSIDDPTWARLTFKTRHLNEWLGAPGVTDQPRIDENKRLVGFALEYTTPSTLHAETGGALIELVSEFSVEGSPLRTRQLSPRASWRVTLRDARALLDLATNYITPLQDLVTLGTATPCPVTDIRVSSAEEVQTGTRTDVEVLYDSHRVGLDASNVLLPTEMLFRADAFANRFEEAMAAWLTARQRFRAACSLVLGSEYARPDMLDNRIMNAVQAAEAFHRERFDSSEKPAGEHAVRLDAVLKSAPSEYRRWLQRKLRFSNEVDLGRRLRELWNHVPAVGAHLAPNGEELIRLLVETRNHLAHKGSLEPDADKARLYHAVEALKYVVKACFLCEMEFDDSEIAGLFAQNRHYEHQAQVGRQLWR
jgi:hypothetical protein